jgi:site-specific DNA recombinase
MFAANDGRVVARRPRKSTRPYALHGLLFCGLCERRMEGSWNSNMIYYRRRGGAAEKTPADQGGLARSVFVQERVLLPKLDSWLGGVAADTQLSATVRDGIANLRDPSTTNRAALYTRLSLHLTYCPASRTMAVQMGTGETSVRTVIAV